jgi:DNA-binding NarL/FixJ family response regulator
VLIRPTLLRQLGASAADTRLIVMTARLDEALEAEASQAGIYAFLSKPAFPRSRRRESASRPSAHAIVRIGDVTG